MVEEEDRRVLVWSCEARVRQEERRSDEVARERQPGQREPPVTGAAVTGERGWFALGALPVSRAGSLRFFWPFGPLLLWLPGECSPPVSRARGSISAPTGEM